MKTIPDKRIGETDAGKLEYALSGQQAPTVVLISGGGQTDMDSWRKVYPQVAEISRVFAYNRFGDGNSDSAGEPQTGIRIVETLRQLLRAAAADAPYILVGHSIGGLYANLFARLYPQEVCGAVLVDSSHPGQGELMCALGGVISLINRGFFALFEKKNPSKASEIRFFDETASQMRRAGAFPDVPLTVITAGKRVSFFAPKGILATIDRHQRELAEMSLQGKQIFAERSGHYVQNSEPEIVIDAIRVIVEQTRNRRD